MNRLTFLWLYALTMFAMSGNHSDIGLNWSSLWLGAVCVPMTIGFISFVKGL